MSYRRICTFAIAFVLSAISNAVAADDKHEIQGEWRVIAQEYKGEVDSGVSFRGMRYAFSKNTYTLNAGTTTPAGLAGRRQLTGPYKVDDKKSPRHLDYTMSAGKSSSKVLAIYKIKDGNLYICFGFDVRPTSFDTKETKHIRYILERVPEDESNKN